MIDATPHNQFNIPDYAGKEKDQIPDFTQNEIDRRFDDIVQREFIPDQEFATEIYKIKAMESDILRMRAGANAETIPRYGINRILHAATQPFMTPLDAKTLHEQLVDIEADIGARIRPLPDGVKSQRFWFLDNGREFQNKNFWYYEAVDGQGTMRASYQVHQSGIVKDVNGLTEPLKPGEQENLLRMIPDYYYAVKNELYFNA